MIKNFLPKMPQLPVLGSVAQAPPPSVAMAGSHLSAAGYGYDFVVAVTQRALNNALLNFLALPREPTVSMCYVANATTGQPTAIDHTALLQLTHGSDPFKIPEGADPNTNQDLINLRNARFLAGFSAQLGLPPVAQPSLLPAVVTLGEQTAGVTFNMLCSTFTIVQLDAGGPFGGMAWRTQSQPHGAPWIFTSRVDMRLSSASQPYNALPASEKQKVMNVSATAFSPEQLIFDLTNASLMSTPTISGVPPGSPAFMLLEQYFISLYFNQMHAQGLSLLGSNIVVQSPSNSTMALNSFAFNVNPYLGSNGQPIAQPTPAQQQLATLNYLCAAAHDGLPPATTFNWNWVDASELNDHDGIISINRNAFAAYLRNSIEPQVAKNCFQTSVRVSLSGVFDTDVNYSASLKGGQKPTATVPPTGATVLRFDYQSTSDDSAGLNGDMGELKLQTTYSLVINFQGSTVVVTEHSVVYMYARRMATSGNGNIVDKMITDTYTLAIDQSGKLAPSLFNTAVVDKSNSPSVNSALNFFSEFNSLSSNITNLVRNAVGNGQQTNVTPLIQGFVFPGSKTFIYKNVKFSNNQDLVSSVSYL